MILKRQVLEALLRNLPLGSDARQGERGIASDVLGNPGGRRDPAKSFWTVTRLSRAS